MAYISPTFNTDNDYIKFRIVVDLNSQSIANNTSNIRVRVQAWRTNNYTTSGTGSCYANADGHAYTDSIGSGQSIYLNSYTTVFDQNSITISHGTDGTKRMYVTSYILHSQFNAGSQGFYINLPTIPRTSVLTQPSNFNLGTPFNLAITKNSASFTDNLEIKVGTTVVRTATNVSNGYTVAFTTEELNTIYALIPNSKTATIRYTITTKSGATTIGTTYKENIGTIVNSNPIFSNFTYEEGDSVIESLTGGNKFVKGYSDIAVNISGENLATSQNYSTITNYKAECGSSNVEVAASTDNNLSIANILSGQINVYARDSRTFESLASINLEALNKWVDYTSPTLSAKLERKNGIEQNVLLVLSGTYMNVNFGSVENSITACEMRYKTPDTETWGSWVNIISYIDQGSGSVVNDPISNQIATTFSLTEYDIEIRIKDGLEYKSYISTLPDGKVAYDCYKDDDGEYHWGFNGMANGEPISINGTGLFNLIYPVGAIHLTTSNVNPGTYITWQTWEAWGTGRVPVAVDTGQTEFDTVEKTGGHKLLQAHTHAQVGNVINSGSTGYRNLVGLAFTGSAQTVNATATTGGGNAENLQPYITCYMWKRIT